MGTLVMLVMLSQVRLVTEHGPVHVSIPPRGGSVTVVYVHGFYTHVDDAWVHHRLAQQLKDSGVDAAFIAPEAPAGPGEAVSWPDLAQLLAEVERQTGATLPQTVIAVGHSGAYRTLGSWATSPRVKAVALLDAFYGSAETWDRFLKADAERRVYVLGRHTAPRSAAFCARQRRATCEASRWPHMQIITEGEALPRALRWAVLDLQA